MSDGGSPRDWRWSELGWAIAWSAALVAVASLPYVYAAATTPSHEHYLGFVFNPDEPNVHLSWIRQASDGAVFLRNEFTSEPHVGRFLNLFMLVAGRLSARFDLTPYQVWQAARIVGGILLGLACYLVLIAVTHRRRERRLGLILLTLSSGLGWFWVGGSYGGPGGVATGVAAVDFVRALLNPLVLVTGLVLLLALVMAERAVRAGDWPAAVTAAAAGLLLSFSPGYASGLLVAWTIGWLTVLSLRESVWDHGRSLRAALIAAAASAGALGAASWLVWLVPLGAGLGAALTVALTPRSEEQTGIAYGELLSGAVVGAAAVLAGGWQIVLSLREEVYFGVLLGLGILGALLCLTERPQIRLLRWPAAMMLFGVGWLSMAALAIDPVDVEPNLVMPEAFTFITIYLNPLFAFSVVLLVAALLLGRRALLVDDWAAAAGAGLTGVLLANVHTYDAVPLLAVWTGYLLLLALWSGEWSWLRFGRWALMVCLVLPAAGYQAWLIRSQPLYAAKALTITATPPLPTMLVSYGLLWPLALLGFCELLRRPNRAFWPLWAVLHLASVYLPTQWFPFQRKMVEGFAVVLGALATVGLVQVARKLAAWLAWPAVYQRYRQVGWAWALRADTACRRGTYAVPLALLGLLLLVPSSAFFVQSTIDHVQHNNREKLPYFMPPFSIPEGDYQALLWMHDQLPHDAVVLCLPWIGSYLPGISGQTAYVAHWAETIDYSHKLGLTGRFYTGAESADEQRRFLREGRIQYVLYGSYEREATHGRRPELPELEQVYPPPEDGPAGLNEVTIWKVVAPAAETTEPAE